MSILIGIDLGTTNIKVCAFNNKGDLLFRSARSTVVEHSERGDTLNPNSLWENVLDLLEETAASINPEEVYGIGIASMAETVFPVDKAGSALAEGIIWYDQCSRKEYETIVRAVSPEKIREITGLRPSWFFSASKILYYRNHFPEIYRQTEMFLDVSGYIAFKMTGEKYMDLSLASRTMLLDLCEGNWSKHLVETFGIEPNKLPPLIPCGFVWGEVLPIIRDKLKLGSKTVVTTAGQDHIAAAYAAGVVGKDKLLDSIGTSEAVLSSSELKTIQSDAFQKQRFFSAGYHAQKGVYYLLDGMPTGGYCIDWLLKRVLMTDYSLLDNIQWRESSIIFFPYLRNSMQGVASAQIKNLTDTDDRDSLAQGIIEGIAFEFKRYVETLQSIRGRHKTLKEIIVVGGGTRNKMLMRIKSEVMDKSLKVLEHPDAAANLGAAMISGTAAGIFKEDWDSNSMRKYLEIYYPKDKKHVQFYKGKYEEYLEYFPYRS